MTYSVSSSTATTTGEEEWGDNLDRIPSFQEMLEVVNTHPWTRSLRLLPFEEKKELSESIVAEAKDPFRLLQTVAVCSDSVCEAEIRKIILRCLDELSLVYRSRPGIREEILRYRSRIVDSRKWISSRTFSLIVAVAALCLYVYKP